LLQFKKKFNDMIFSYFVDEPPPIAQGGKGVIVSGCPACRKRINTMGQFLDHLANDALPALIEKLAAQQSDSSEQAKHRCIRISCPKVPLKLAAHQCVEGCYVFAATRS
jgi:hypothetical protein